MNEGRHSSSDSGLLTYAAIPNLQGDFDSITSDVKSTAETRPDFYDRSPTIRRYPCWSGVFEYH
jgi:hypothetical protein